MKKICLIHTGGTIGMVRTLMGFSPKAGYLQTVLDKIDDLRAEGMPAYDLIELDPLLDSSDMAVDDWNRIGEVIAVHYDNYDGFVILHGTDTMAYASAMLYYLIQNSPKPIVLTGAQIPIENRDTDARENLADAFAYAVDDGACGVHIVFDGKIIAATRARKTRTKSFNAFSSIDYPEIGFVRGGIVRYYIREQYTEALRFFREIDSAVAVIKLIPGMRADIFDYVADHCHAVIIESFGVGGIPYYENDEFANKIEMLSQRGVRIVITTQVPHEGSDMSVYQVGLRIKQKYELPEAYDMTTEAVVAKVMWALPQTENATAFKDLFLKTVGNDMI